MIRQLVTISQNTFLESIRQPVFIVLLMIAAIALILNPSMAAYTLEDDNRLMIDVGLSTLFLAGLLLAAFTATGVLSTEIESQTLLTVVSKPVPRPVFVVGKYLGVAGATAMAYWVLMLIFLLTVRHRVLQTAMDPLDGPVLAFGLTAGLGSIAWAALANYWYRCVFTSTLAVSLAGLMALAWLLVMLIDKDWAFQSITAEFAPDGALLGGQMLYALAMILEAVLLLTAIAVTVSTRLKQVMTMTVCFGAFLVGLVSDYLATQYAGDFAWASVVQVVVPNLQLLWPTDALAQGNTISPGYLAWVSVYTTVYTTAVLCLAVILFQKREV